MCDTIGALGDATATRSPIFGKNSDRDYLEAQYLEMRLAARHEAGTPLKLTYKTIEQARQTHAVLLSRPHWIWGAEIGANEHGLVIGNEAIFAKVEASLTEEIIGMDYLRLALERARDVDEAIHVITTLLSIHGQGGNAGFRRVMAYHNSFMLADPRSIKVLETVDRDWVVKAVDGHYAISNAMTIEAFRDSYEDSSRTIGGRHRRARAMELLGARHGSLGVPDFFEVLRDHQEGPVVDGRPGARICAHRRESPIGQTTASLVADVRPGKAVHWVTGTSAPCTSLFKPVTFESGLPDHGPKPGGQEERLSLWWRHEQIRRRLDAASEEVREEFARERGGLETLFLELVEKAEDSHGSCPPEVVEECWARGIAWENRWHEVLGG